MSVEVAGWNIGPPGWAKAMQGVGQLTVTPTSRYNRYKTQLSEILTDLAKQIRSLGWTLHMPRQDAERYDDAVWNGGRGNHSGYFGISSFLCVNGF